MSNYVQVCAVLTRQTFGPAHIFSAREARRGDVRHGLQGMLLLSNSYYHDSHLL